MKARVLEDLLAFADDSIEQYQAAVDKFKQGHEADVSDADAPPSVAAQTAATCADAYANVVAGFRAIRRALEGLQVDEVFSD